MHILAIEPFYSDSHKQFLDGLIRHSRHDYSLLTLPGRFWKWRNTASGIQLSERLEESMKECELILASDFLNLSDFAALNRHWLGTRPLILYMHENQLSYPQLEAGSLDRAYPLLNISSCAVADSIIFNSPFHREEFFRVLPRFLQSCPDKRPRFLEERLFARSHVLSPGIETAATDAAAGTRDPRLILWNHRWEHDKNPEAFFKALFRLKEAGEDFRVAVCGQSYKQVPAIFEEARRKLADRIIHFGHLPARTDYEALLTQSGIVVSTARHEFFGIAAAEAVRAGARPLFPNRLNYPNLLPENLHARCLYEDDEYLSEALRAALRAPLSPEDEQSLQAHISQFAWPKLAPRYDTFFEEVLHEPV